MNAGTVNLLMATPVLRACHLLEEDARSANANLRAKLLADSRAQGGDEEWKSIPLPLEALVNTLASKLIAHRSHPPPSLRGCS